jgi:hypothetical protein
MREQLCSPRLFDPEAVFTGAASLDQIIQMKKFNLSLTAMGAGFGV